MKNICYPVIVLPEELAEMAVRVVTPSGFAEQSFDIRLRSTEGDLKTEMVLNEDLHISFEEILWIAVNDNDSCVISLEHDRKMTVHVGFPTLEKELPVSDFMKISRTCIVNLRQVKSMIGNSLKVGKAFLMISPDFRKEVCARFVFIGVRTVRDW